MFWSDTWTPIQCECHLSMYRDSHYKDKTVVRPNAYTGNSIYHIPAPDYFISLRVTSLAQWQAHFDGLAQGCSNSSALHKATDFTALVRGRQSPRIIDRWMPLLMLIDLGCVWQMDREWQTHTMCRLRISPKWNKSDFCTMMTSWTGASHSSICDPMIISSLPSITMMKWIHIENHYRMCAICTRLYSYIYSSSCDVYVHGNSFWTTDSDLL